MASRNKTLLGILFASGLLATLVVSVWIAKTAREQRESVRDQGAETIAGEADFRVTAALKAAEGIGQATDTVWPTVEEYEAFWGSYSSVLPGDPTTALVLGVPTEDLAGFVAAESVINPGFTLSLVNDDPPNGQSLISVRSGGSQIPLGVDLTSLPGGTDRLLGVVQGSPSFANADIREPATQPGFLQVISRVEVKGPDSVTRDAWSVVQIDLQRILADVVGEAGDEFGATFEMADIGPGGAYGIEAPINGGATVTRTFDADVIEFKMDLWHDGRSIGDVSVAEVRIVGLGATVALTLFGYLLLSLRANRRRAREGERDARHDPLTGLANRRWVSEYLQEHLGSPVAVLFCDLDRFKVVNDSAGHAAGDDLLIEVGSRIQNTLGPNSSVARFGGDEFLVLCSSEDCINTDSEALAHQIRSVLDQPFDVGGSQFRTTISIGIATTQRMDSDQPEELIRAADVALGMCKQAGGNGIVRYDDSLREAELDRLELERNLQDALDRGDFVMYYQPIVDRQQRPVSYEALVRWRRNGALVPPDAFLPVVKEIGRMPELGEIVLNLAIADFTAGIDSNLSTTLHVNVDAAQLSDGAFADQVEVILQLHGLNPGRLILELTEGEWAESIDAIGPVLEALNTLGVRVAIDDFGTGHSSLSRALDVKALSEVKLDRSVIRQLFEPRNHAFFSGFTDTLMRIGVTVVAEGIETVEDFNCVQDAGIGLFQGYMFARPTPAEETNFASREPHGPLPKNAPTNSSSIAREPTHPLVEDHPSEQAKACP